MQCKHCWGNGKQGKNRTNVMIGKNTKQRKLCEKEQGEGQKKQRKRTEKTSEKNIMKEKTSHPVKKIIQ